MDCNFIEKTTTKKGNSVISPHGREEYTRVADEHKFKMYDFV